MKIPNKLKIGGHIVKVIIEEMTDCGESDFKKGIIRIDSKLPQSQKESTLIHEIIHYCNSTLGGTLMGHSLQDSLSEQLYQVFSDNKLLNNEK